jgi:hypothetical protein
MRLFTCYQWCQCTISSNGRRFGGVRLDRGDELVVCFAGPGLLCGQVLAHLLGRLVCGVAHLVGVRRAASARSTSAVAARCFPAARADSTSASESARIRTATTTWRRGRAVLRRRRPARPQQAAAPRGLINER